MKPTSNLDRYLIWMIKGSAHRLGLACTLMFAVAVLFFFSSSLTSLTLANEGPHGGYTLTTANCAGCHRPHTASKTKLLKGDGVDTTLNNSSNYDIADLCFSCHKDGAGANDNVYRGIFMGFAGPGDSGSSLDPSTNPWPYEPSNTAQYGIKNAGLNGGGFAYAKPYWGEPRKVTYNGRTHRGVAWTDPIGGTHFDHTATDEAATTSFHNALDDTKTWTVWGSTMAGSTTEISIGPGMLVTLKCTSCHDQHGSMHYRILRDSRSDARITQLIPGFVTQFDRGVEKATQYPSYEFPIKSWETEFSPGGLTKDYTSYSYRRGTGATITEFCGTCHNQYMMPIMWNTTYASYDAGDNLKDPLGNDYPRWLHVTIHSLGGAPSKCGSTLGDCAVINQNKWIQLPAATGAMFFETPKTVDGIRNGVPVYMSSLDVSEDYVVCTTCHQAHGTVTTMSSGARVGPTKTAAGSDPGHSNLLRLDNRAICENCHGWSKLKDENGIPCPKQNIPSSCVDPIGPP